MIVCGIDFETTGTDTSKDRITEVGAVLFNEVWQPQAALSFMVWDPGYPLQSSEVIAVTGITDEMLRAKGIPFADAYKKIVEFAGSANYFVAHNAKFDNEIWVAECKRHGLNPATPDWVCSMVDLKSNKQFKSHRLAHLALEYMVPVDPRRLHRAVNDVELMGEMLAGAKADIVQMAQYRNAPNIVIQALIPAPWTDGGKGKKAAQERGFNWQQPRGTELTFPQMWVKQIKESELDDEQRQAPFKLKRVK